MKRILLALMLLVTASLSSLAQSPLQISQIFNGKYASDPDVTETMITGNHQFLKKHKLSMFSTFKGPASEYSEFIEPLVLADGTKAIGRNIRYKKGVLHYAFFMLSPVKEKGKTINRFLYYLNNEPQKGKNLMVVYFEGSLNQNDANDLIRSITSSK